MLYTCSVCNVEKEASEYYKEKRRASGLSARCKVCHNNGLKKNKVECAQCKEVFETSEKGRKYCSRDCYYVVNAQKPIKGKVATACPICSKEFEVWRSHKSYYERLYCSIPCKNIGAAKYFSGKDSPHWNHSLSDEDRLSARKYEAYYQWRKDVFARDNYTCRCCGDSSGGNLIAHHILNYSEHESLRTVVGNGLTLCVVCHKEFHDTFGYVNNNEDQLIEFISTKTPIPQEAFLLYPFNKPIPSQARPETAGRCND